jgi:hypothetical protein
MRLEADYIALLADILFEVIEFGLLFIRNYWVLPPAAAFGLAYLPFVLCEPINC